jgi:hypothetical protein
MLRNLPRKRSRFPALRYIVIRFAEIAAPSETLTKVESFQEKLQAIGIHSETEEVTKHKT